MMTPYENLHYAIGELAYAIASADGFVQEEERDKFHDIVAAELRSKNYGFDISDIIFQILDKEKEDTETTYQWAMNQIRLNSHYLSPELKKTFVCVIEKIAKAYPPVSKEESKLMERFRTDFEQLKGDPIYYKR